MLCGREELAINHYHLCIGELYKCREKSPIQSGGSVAAYSEPTIQDFHLTRAYSTLASEARFEHSIRRYAQ